MSVNGHPGRSGGGHRLARLRRCRPARVRRGRRPGSIDTSFGTGGTVITDLGAAGTTELGGPDRVIVLGNGDILVGGTQGVARLLPDGSLDPTFGSGGVATLRPGDERTYPDWRQRRARSYVVRSAS